MWFCSWGGTRLDSDGADGQMLAARRLCHRVALRPALCRRLCSAESAEPPPPPPSTVIYNPDIDDNRHTASVLLNSGPVNALSTQVCLDLTAAVRECEEQEVHGIVISSALNGVYSAGADLPALLLDDDSPDLAALAEFYTALQEMWLALYTTPIATVAAISGHCPAGGCLLALSCDARVMVEQGQKGRIGLNQTAFGLVPAPWVSRMMRDTIGQRPAERLVQTGALLTAEEALGVGLVDEVVPSLAGLTGAANARLAELLAVPHAARGAAKRQLRAEAAEALRSNQMEDLDEFVQFVSTPAAQAAVRARLEALKS